MDCLTVYLMPGADDKSEQNQDQSQHVCSYKGLTNVEVNGWRERGSIGERESKELRRKEFEGEARGRQEERNGTNEKDGERVGRKMS